MDNWEKKLNEKGIRCTESRLAVIRTIQSSKKALSPLQIFDLSRKECPHLGLVTVYRTLEILERQGLLERVHKNDNCQTVLPAGEGHQHILLCAYCDKAIHFEGEDLSDLFFHIQKNTGFQIKEHWLQLIGICPDCILKTHETL